MAGPWDFVRAPRDVQPGDMLLAFVTSSNAFDVSDIELTGGNPWVPQAELADDFGTRVFAQVAGLNNPTWYQVELNGEGLVGLLHIRGGTPDGLLLVSDSGGYEEDSRVPAPDASPGIAGGVEVRYAVLWNSLFESAWGRGQFPTEDWDLADDNTAAYLGAKTLLTGADVPVKLLDTDSSLVEVWQAWTVVVTPADYVPPPPPVPAFAQGKGTALYRFTAHDFKTGTYLDDLYPQDVSYDKRIGEAGAFTGRLPIPNAQVAQAVRRIIPRLRSDMATGPGRFEVRIWREGVLWGRYWITGARLTRGRDGRISVELRGSTVDAYFQSLRVRDDIFYQGNPVANVRALLSHAMTKPGAWSGLTFQEGSAGGDRLLLINGDDGHTYGRASQDQATGDGGFEWTINEQVGESGVESTWVWGFPKLTSDRTHVFTESPHGGEIAEWALDIDALQGGTDWETRGGTPESDASEDAFPLWSNVVATGHRAAGWPRLDHQLDHPEQSLVKSELNNYSAYWAEAAGGALWVRQITVILGANPSLNMNCLGDYARFIMSNVWYERTDEGGAGLDIRERIIGIQVRPTSKGVGKEEAVLTLETLEVPTS